MNIFEYIDKKRNEYEILRDESQIQLKTNLNRIQTISSQIKHMTEEEENPSKYFLPETAENYEKEIVELQDKINVLEFENSALSEKISQCDEELHLLDTLELPDFESAEKNMAWMPMVISEEEFQKKNVSRETFLNEEQLTIVSRETTNASGLENGNLGQAMLNVSRETMDELESESFMPELNHIEEKIQFCRQISELDPRRCGLLLGEILNDIDNFRNKSEYPNKAGIDGIVKG